MARRFAKALEEEIEEAFFYPSDSGNSFLLSGETHVNFEVLQ